MNQQQWHSVISHRVVETVSFTVCFVCVWRPSHVVNEMDELWQLDRGDLAINHHPDW